MSFVKKLFISFGLFQALVLPTIATAASIEPNTINVSLVPGQTVTLNRTVILDDTGPAASRVDVMFLSDTTGSMGGVINTVRNNAQSILDAIAGGDPRFAGIDVQFGVASYKGDPREFGGTPDVRANNAYQLQQAITDSRDSVTTAIGQWGAGGGGDGPEANFFALHQVVTEGGPTDGVGSTDVGFSTALSTGWRPGAVKVIVWFGDIVSHTTTVDVQEAITALTDNNVIVAAINTRGANTGIDGGSQASQIVAATGGSLTNNVVGSQTTIDAILNAVENATDTVDLALVTDGLAQGVDVSFQCISPAGCDDVAAGESREFAMQISATTPGTYVFNTLVPQISGLIANDVVNVRECVNDVTARAKRDKVELIWTDTGADHYAIYRSDSVDGNYQLIGQTSSRYSVYVDRGLTPNTAYFYQVREQDAAGNETCSSVTAPATTSLRGRPDGTPINVAPVFTSTPVTSAIEDSVYTYVLAASDTNGDVISFSLISGPTGMQLTGDTLSWTPVNANVGQQTVVVRAQDPSGLFDDQSFVITVSNTNDAPNIVSTAPVMARVNEPYQYAVNAIDIDVGDTLGYSLIQAPTGMTVNATSGVINWTPAFTQQGSFGVVLRVTDQAGAFAEQSYSITVEAVNNPPQITSTPQVAADVGADYRYQMTITDPDVGDVHQYSLVTGPTGAVMDANTGLLSWDGVVVGSHEMTVRVTDYGGLTDTQTFNLVVTAPNTAPVITSTPVLTATEAVTYSYNVMAQDADGDALTYSLVTAPAGMSISATGEISWVPALTQIGTQDVVVSVSDGQASANQNFTIDVAPRANTAPTITSVPVGTVVVDANYSYQVVAQDAESDPLSYSLIIAPVGMTISPTGLVSWTASVTLGDYNIEISVSDDRGASTTQSFVLTVEDVPNNPPVISSTPVTNVIEDNPYQYQVTATDHDGDSLSFALLVAPTGMSVNATTGLATWTPSNAQIGTHAVTVQVSDGNGGTANQSFSVIVSAQPNNAPVFTSTPITTATADTPYSYDANATDADGDTLSFSLTAAPSGMSINATSGVVSWSPTTGQIGSHPVAIQVSDGNGGTANQSFSIVVTAQPNNAPVFTSTPITSATEDTPYSYDANATDADGDTLTFSLDVAPTGMTINPTSGVVSWTPNASQVGNQNVVVRVSDGNGGATMQSFAISVSGAANQVPSITSTPATSATVDQLYQYDVNATDADGDTITYSLDVAPAGMSINGTTGLITWTPTSSQTGTHAVTVRAADASSFETQSFNINVADVALPVEVFVQATPSVIDQGQTTTINVSTTGGTGAVNTVLTVNGTPIALDGSGNAVVTGTVIGGYELIATATDSIESISATGFFSVRDPADSAPPTVSIDTPVTDSEITEPVDIVGTVNDTNLVNYRLLVAPAGSGDYTELNLSTNTVVDGVLGRFDPTLLANGLYDVAVIAIDANGQQSSQLVTYRVTGDMKVGNFSITIEDLSIPVSGIPIIVNRTYDTRRKAENLDFGYGWSIDYQDVKVEENMVLGQAWQQTATGGFFPTYCIDPVGEHIVSVTLPDGTTEEFDMAVSPRCQQLIPLQFTDPVFNPRSGTTSTLVAQNVGQLWYVGGELLESGFFEPYDPDVYTLTTREGYVYQLDQNFGIRTVRDPNGNTLTYSSNGIVHSSGKSVNFTRDGQGRITEITDPNGNVITYSYDSRGDLASVTDREGNTTRHTYNRNHGLVDFIDPRGITPARNIYDDDGRLVANIDADGNRIEYTNDVDGRQDIVQDRLGRTTVSVYDENGYVLSSTDPLGNVTSFTYDGNGNVLTETDANGNVVTKTYDANDNPLTETDALGNTITRTFNSRNQELTKTDANGNVTEKAYDANGNVTQQTDALGNTVTYGYDASGNQTAVTNEIGSSTSFAFDASGNRTQETDPFGGVTTFSYDDNGNPTSESKVRTTSSGPVTVTTQKTYTAGNRIESETDGLGNTTTFEYNSIGLKSAEIDKNGNRTEYEYDARGNRTLVRYADGTTETASYDAEQNKISETDRQGRTTLYEYDGLNRLILVTYPDGSDKRLGYDAVGNVTSKVDGNGNVTSELYDEVGRRVSVSKPEGVQLDYTYDPNGNPTSITDSNGNTYQHVYDEMNNRIRTIFPDGSTKEFSYDGVSRKTSETDQAGNVTQFGYDALSQLVSVTDALGGITNFTYDEFGNKLTQTDANGNVTSWEYDNVGNVLSRTLPNGQIESFTYDANGNKLTHTSFNGDTVDYAYDSNNRLTRKTYPNSDTVDYTYSATGKITSVTDGRGTTSYDYDVRDRIVRLDYPDSNFIEYTYDAAGNILTLETPSGTTTNTYDDANRLVSVTDQDGGLTSYSYDAVGNRASITYPNNTVTTYTYDSSNRLTRLENRRSDDSIISTYDYVLGPAGNRVQMIENTGRTTDYTYDALYRLTQEVITDGLSTTTIDYTYDAVGNRLTKTIDGGVASISYTYDENDRLLTEGSRTYTYDDNGNRLTRSDGINTDTYSYDYDNRMVSVSTPTSNIDYAYDVNGIRMQQIVDGVETNFLVDPNRDYAQVLEERNASNTVVVRYVYGDDLISQIRGSATNYYHYDGLGSTRALTDNAETITDTYHYDAFGLEISRTGTTENNYLYTGEQYDPNIGFYYLRARYMDPNVGSFIGMDPFAGLMFEPMTLHRYLYAGMDPVNKIDPSGEFFGFVGLGLRMFAFRFLYYGSPLLYLAQRVVARINIASLTRLVNHATNSFYRNASYNLGMGRRILRLDAGRVFEGLLRPAMALLRGQYHQRIPGAIPDWIVRGRHIVDAKLGQAINLRQLRNFARWAQGSGGNITYITLTRTPASVKAQAAAIANQFGVRISYIPLTPF